MGVWKRIMDVSKAAVNEALDKLEQPEMMMNQYLRNTKEDIETFKQEILKETVSQRMWEQQIAANSRLAEQSEQKAGEAMADYREAEARQAIETKLAHLDKAAEYTQCLEASKLRTAILEKQLQQAETDYAAMQAKREELVQRAHKVEAHAPTKRPAGMTHGLEVGSALRGFQRIEETIKHRETQLELEQAMRAEAAAAREALVQEQLASLRNKAALS